MDLTLSFDPYRELIVRTAKARWHLDEIAALRARAAEIIAAHSREMQASLHALKHNLPRPRWTITHNEADRAESIYLLMPRLAHQSELLVARDCNEALGKHSPYWSNTGWQDHASEAEFHELLALVRRLEVGNRRAAIGQRTEKQEPEAVREADEPQAAHVAAEEARACVHHGNCDRSTVEARRNNQPVSETAPKPSSAPASWPALSPSNGHALIAPTGPTKRPSTKPNRDKPTRVRHQQTNRRHQTHRPWSINQALYGALQTKPAPRPKRPALSAVDRACHEHVDRARPERVERACPERVERAHPTPTNQKTGPGGACLAVAA